MSKSVPSKITVFFSLDQRTIDDYFNIHDPAPIYKRQLSHAFEHYIMSSIQAVKRYTVINYKIYCKSENDKDYIDSFLYAIRGHFLEKKRQKQEEFLKFKHRTYSLLFVSLAVVMICQGFVPYILNVEH